jgi:hypothetical protein
MRCQHVNSGDEPLAIECVGDASARIALADLVGGHLLAAVARHSYHATAARKHDAADRRVAKGSGLLASNASARARRQVPTKLIMRLCRSSPSDAITPWSSSGSHGGWL